MRTIPIIVNIRSDGIDVNPTYVNVPNDNGQDVKLKWTVIGGSFPTSGCFAWKNSPVGAPTVACPTSSGDNRIESAGYTNNFDPGRVWQYTITVIKDSGGTVTIDPEVNNEPPTP
ncbi:MAG TPA: hypothetical protein VGQ36_09510 [Thermoanaerobaculia bacterium]|jgi:hypothetical protein|nr:hypothetical protein [Thermoanaerobaculia bacterium]